MFNIEIPFVFDETIVAAMPFCAKPSDKLSLCGLHIYISTAPGSKWWLSSSITIYCNITQPTILSGRNVLVEGLLQRRQFQNPAISSDLYVAFHTNAKEHNSIGKMSMTMCVQSTNNIYIYIHRMSDNQDFCMYGMCMYDGHRLHCTKSGENIITHLLLLTEIHVRNMTTI